MQEWHAARERAVTVLGLGRLPLAPGTWCSAGCTGVYLALGLLPDFFAMGIIALLFVLSTGLGLWLGRWAAAHYGEADPGEFVLDEAAGFWLTALLFWHPNHLLAAGAVLMAFRFFDIVKCWPLRRLEELRPPIGIMVDDLGAALYAAGLLWVFRYLV